MISEISSQSIQSQLPTVVRQSSLTQRFHGPNIKNLQNGNQSAVLQAAVVEKIKAGNYDPNVPPITRPDAGVAVYVRLLIHRLIWFENQAEAHITLKEEWQDARLEISSKNAMSFTPSDNLKIWEPDTYFPNGEEAPLGDKEFKVIEESGFIRTNRMRSVRIPFKEESRFPFINRKKFRLRLSSYRYSSKELIYQWAPTLAAVELTDQVLTDRYKNESYQIQDCTKYVTDTHSCIEIVVTFVGPVKQGIFKVFLPSLLLVFASWLHFWIFGSWSVPRTLSAAFPFFLFAVLLMFFPDLYEDYSRGTRTWFVACLLFTFASFVEYFLVICCGMKRTARYANGILDGESTGTTKEPPDNRMNAHPMLIRNDSSIDILSRLLFPLLFVIFLAIYLLVQML